MKNQSPKIVKEHYLRSGISMKIEFPAKRALCRRCDGKGTHVNPNIDGNGISPEEFHDDPDFTESYFSGVYDVACYECNGEKVILEADESRFTKRQRILWSAIMESEYQDRRERESEARWEY